MVLTWPVAGLLCIGIAFLERRRQKMHNAEYMKPRALNPTTYVIKSQPKRFGFRDFRFSSRLLGFPTVRFVSALSVQD